VAYYWLALAGYAALAQDHVQISPPYLANMQQKLDKAQEWFTDASIIPLSIHQSTLPFKHFFHAFLVALHDTTIIIIRN
jgi:hypothetical protein